MPTAEAAPGRAARVSASASLSTRAHHRVSASQRFCRLFKAGEDVRRRRREPPREIADGSNALCTSTDQAPEVAGRSVGE